MPTEMGGCWSSGMYTRRRMTSKRPQQAQRCSSGAFVFGSSWWVEEGSEIEGEELQKCVLKSHHQQVEGARCKQSAQHAEKEGDPREDSKTRALDLD